MALAFAREGADVVISYLPEEEPDAQATVELVEAAGRRAVRPRRHARRSTAGAW